MELGRRVSFPRGFKVAARHEARCEWAGVGAMSQLWIAAGEQSSLLTHIAATVNAFVVRRMES